MTKTQTISRANPERIGAVLGHFPLYREAAQDKALASFQLDPEAAKHLGAAGCWQRNRAFLDQIIAARQPVLLASAADHAHPASWFARELGYLEGRGYRLTADGSMMVPPVTLAL